MSPAAMERIRARDKSRSRRHRVVRSKTFDLRRFPKRDLELLRIETKHDLELAGDVFTPVTRADCANVPRPCPHVSCRFNLYLDVMPGNGSIKLNFPDLEPDEMPENASCALDIADQGAATLDRIGEILNMTRERVRQIENAALEKVRPSMRALEDGHVHLPMLNGKGSGR